MTRFKVGDRLISNAGSLGEILLINEKYYRIRFDSGTTRDVTLGEFQTCKYRLLKVDDKVLSFHPLNKGIFLIAEYPSICQDVACWNLAILNNSVLLHLNDVALVGDRVKVANHKEKYYSDHDWGIITNISSKKIDVKMGDRFIIAVDIADIKEKMTCNNLTYAQESAQDSHLPQQFLEDFNSLESRKSTVTAATSSANDFQTSTTTAISEPCQGAKLENIGEKSTSSQLRRRASRSVSKGNGKVQQTNETVSPQLNEPSSQLGQDSSVLKMCQDSSTAQSSQGEQHSIFSTFYGRFPASAMMLNGFVSVQGCLEVPTLEKDFCWLESPGALSAGKGRPPGQTKQEAQLKKLGILAPGEVCNPEFLENACNLPLGWTDPQDERSSLELIKEMGLCAIAAQPSEMPLIGESPPSLSSESNILNILDQSTSKIRKSRGCLYHYLEKKKSKKSGEIIIYPRIEGGDLERDSDKPEHWRWGFNYEIKIDGKWKGRSIGSIPIHALEQIKLMQNQNADLEEIISFIKSSKNAIIVNKNGGKNEDITN